MHKNFSMLAILSSLMLIISTGLAQAESSQDFGDYVVHFNSLTTDMLPPDVTKQYGIKRSKNRGMLNVTILRKILDTTGQPVPAKVSASAENLTGQRKELEMREIHEGNAIYYISEFQVANEETLNFTIEAQPQGHTSSLIVKFRRQFFSH